MYILKAHLLLLVDDHCRGLNSFYLREYVATTSSKGHKRSHLDYRNKSYF